MTLYHALLWLIGMSGRFFSVIVMLVSSFVVALMLGAFLLFGKAPGIPDMVGFPLFFVLVLSGGHNAWKWNNKGDIWIKKIRKTLVAEYACVTILSIFFIYIAHSIHLLIETTGLSLADPELAEAFQNSYLAPLPEVIRLMAVDVAALTVATSLFYAARWWQLDQRKEKPATGDTA